MVMERYFSGTTAENDYNQNDIPLKCKPMKADRSEDNKASDSMDCNICLDFVQDPVVTFCGHLYCWPCIYKWIRFQSEPSQQIDQQPPHCPVCKAEISQEAMIPLYGKGLTTPEPSKGKAFHLDLDIPQRPQSPKYYTNERIVYTPTVIANRVPQLSNLSRPQQAQRYHDYTSSPGSYVSSPAFSLGGGGGGDRAITDMSHPGMGMFGEMVYARMFGNSETTVYAYPNSYNLVSTSPRIRRHLMEADKSLSRLTFFFMCCMILCLLLF